MRVFQFIILAAIVALFLGLAGCEEPKGHLELKEPKKELSEMPERKVWNVSDGFPDAEDKEE